MATDHPFTGFALNAVDSKGRVSVPHAFREVIATRCLVYGAGDSSVKESALEIGPHEDFNRLQAFDVIGKREMTRELEEGLADLPASERRRAKADAMGDELGTVLPVSFDSAGRMQLSGQLRRVAKLDDLALFYGVGDYFEIWNPLEARRAWADNPRRLWAVDGLLEERGIAL